ncbi:putative lysyl-tRNA synthetase [Afipia carboxidovorans OM5]|uniref:Lysine-tRNA ligase GenX n=1 Tax=Afipia carboxidovorans (strain ATCC 49405 / DSM 1227 / KCTC 32145 / OM5) TaxID=504832 RepID=B6JHH9_AFIC5|nr:EF-P lysine aminoacylase EpmA [Afipia carboxidovorans]ACI93145.1 putative lysyl-tRNA synthetase [Afipia carboxidovorans OM5]AEI03132.1 lysine-tRNA ligase GenX [Afipia carboxidovorans OM4]AEI06709.1 lysine-tRNA ligase GenX [Afipia carboxidovorans OM5]
MMVPSKASPWWDRERHQDRQPFLRQRAAITRTVRDWFAAEGFVEVETGILQVSPGNETHLHALRAEGLGGSGQTSLYMRTSPEFACKKLLAAGEERIVEFAKVFRGREDSPLHLTEFTMLEWYRAGAPYATITDDCAAVVARAAEAACTRRFAFRGKTLDPFAPPERLTVAEAFQRFASLDLLATVEGNRGNRDALAAMAASITRVSNDDDWSDIFSKVLTEHVEPKLGEGRLTILFDYPSPEAALARTSPQDARVAERFEVYGCGVELANGFGELNDAAEQRRRFAGAMDEKERRYGERYPLDEDFLAALAQMPEASGVALGFDRLVMLASGATRLDQVVWAPLS